MVRRYREDPLNHDRISVSLGIGMLDAGEWALEHAAEFPLPLLLMHGGADPVTSAPASQEFASRVGALCTLKLWDGLYHETHNEPQAPEIFAFLLSWLEAHRLRESRTPVSASPLDK
jgi:alpha-beta hydrolase superfamily lysophospholipase